MTARQQVEGLLIFATTPPDYSEIKNTLIESVKWTDATQTASKYYSYEQGVEAALKWVLGITNENPIDIEYENK